MKQLCYIKCTCFSIRFDVVENIPVMEYNLLAIYLKINWTQLLIPSKQFQLQLFLAERKDSINFDNRIKALTYSKRILFVIKQYFYHD